MQNSGAITDNPLRLATLSAEQVIANARRYVHKQKIDARRLLLRSWLPEHTHSWTDSQPIVYFVAISAETSYIKIGRCHRITAMRSRLMGLQTGSPHPVELLAIVAGDRSVEAGLHSRFQALHVRGEWFRAGVELIDYLAGLP